MTTFKCKIVVQIIAVEINDLGVIVNEHVIGTEPVYYPFGLTVEALVNRKMAEIQPAKQGKNDDTGTG